MRKQILTSLVFTCVLGLSSVAFALPPAILKTLLRPRLPLTTMAIRYSRRCWRNLKRHRRELQWGKLQRPYYIDYQVTELEDHLRDATLGAMRTDNVNRAAAWCAWWCALATTKRTAISARAWARLKSCRPIMTIGPAPPALAGYR